jgi:hypothetical protein
MKTIIGVIIGLALGITIGVTGDVLATPPPDKHSTEAMLQALEYLLWTEDHAINAVSQRVWNRYSSCNLRTRYDCYTNDIVLMAFNVKDKYGDHPSTDVMDYEALSACSYGTWYAQDNGDGDSWNVWVTTPGGGHYTWTVWQSNGFIRGVY